MQLIAQAAAIAGCRTLSCGQLGYELKYKYDSVQQ